MQKKKKKNNEQEKKITRLILILEASLKKRTAVEVSLERVAS